MIVPCHMISIFYGGRRPYEKRRSLHTFFPLRIHWDVCLLVCFIPDRLLGVLQALQTLQALLAV